MLGKILFIISDRILFDLPMSSYLLSPITSPMGGIGSPSTRLVLLGSRNPHHWPIFYKDPDPVILSEIAEFAMSLANPPKGQEPFRGLPHLQAYRLIRATSLAEVGHIDIAKRFALNTTSFRVLISFP